MGADMALMPLVSSVTIACGAHAGDPLVVWRTLELAAAHRVAVGRIQVVPICRAAVGVPLRHVKPHGTAHHGAAEDVALAEAIAWTVRAFDPGLVLVARAGS